MEHWHYNNECPDCGRVWSEHRFGYSAYRCDAEVPPPPAMTDLEKLLAEVTPGWRVSHVYDENGWYGSSVTMDDVETVWFEDNPEPDQANARLIAMAPDLLRKVIAAEKLVEAAKNMHLNLTEGDFISTTRIDALGEALAAWESAQ